MSAPAWLIFRTTNTKGVWAEVIDTAPIRAETALEAVRYAAEHQNMPRHLLGRWFAVPAASAVYFDLSEVTQRSREINVAVAGEGSSS